MEWLKNPLNVLIVCLSTLAALTLVLVFIKAGVRLKFGKDGGEASETTTTTTTTSQVPKCDSFQQEHMLILQELKAGLAEVAIIARGLDRLQIAQSEGLDVLLGLAEGEKVNGQVKEARRKLAVAEGFKEATEGGTG